MSADEHPMWVLTETCADIEGELPECPVCGADPGQQCRALDPERPGKLLEVSVAIHALRAKEALDPSAKSSWFSRLCARALALFDDGPAIPEPTPPTSGYEVNRKERIENALRYYKAAHARLALGRFEGARLLARAMQNDAKLAEAQLIGLMRSGPPPVGVEILLRSGSGHWYLGNCSPVYGHPGKLTLCDGTGDRQLIGPNDTWFVLPQPNS